MSSTAGAHDAHPSIDLPDFRGRATRSASDEALLSVSTYIRLSDHKRGDRLPPLRVVALEVGHPQDVVRQALQTLERADVVSVRVGRGGGISIVDLGHMPDALSPLYPPVAEDGVDALLEAWAIVERDLLTLAAERATPEGIAVLRRKLDDVSLYPANPLYFMERTVRFNLAAASLGRNPYLMTQFTELTNAVAFVAARYGYIGGATRAEFDGTLRHYQDIFRAIETGDQELVLRTSAQSLELRQQLRF